MIMDGGELGGYFMYFSLNGWCSPAKKIVNAITKQCALPDLTTCI